MNLRSRFALVFGGLATLGGGAVLGLWLWLHSGAEGEGKAPPRGATASLPEPPESSILVPLTIPLATLQDALEASVPAAFLNEEGRDLGHGFTLVAHITRAGALHVTATDGALQTEVPVETTLTVQPPLGVAPITVRCALLVTALTELHLGDTWVLATHTALHYTWVKPPVLRIAGLAIPVQALVDSRLDSVLSDLAARIDDRLRERDAVHAQVSALWTSLRDPLPLAGVDRAWLQIQPSALMATDLAVSRAGIALQVGLRGRFGVVLGEAPPPSTLGALPRREAPKGDPAFTLQMPILLDWEALGRALAPRIVGKAQEVALPGCGGTATWTVRGLSLYPSGRSVVAVVDYTLDGAASLVDGDGRIYLSGVPALDVARGELRLTELSAAMDAGDATSTAVNGLVKAGAISLLADELRFPLADPLAAARTQINAGLRGAGHGPATIQGAVSEPQLGSVLPTDDALVVTVLLNGHASLSLSAMAPLPPLQVQPRLGKPGRPEKKPARRAARGG